MEGSGDWERVEPDAESCARPAEPPLQAHQNQETYGYVMRDSLHGVVRYVQGRVV